MLKICYHCKKTFSTNRNKRKFCSHICALKAPWNTIQKRGQNNISKRPEVREKMRQAKIGYIPWNKGTKGVMKAWNKGLKCLQWSGKKHGMWKGGKIKHDRGYLFIYSSNHPFRNKRNYVFEHRLVMEKKLKRFLGPTEVIHHINGIKIDNRIENLQLFNNQSEHIKLHLKNRYA